MSHSSLRRLLDRGRKAGLNTNELYRALSVRTPQIGDGNSGQADSNGYVVQIQPNGQRVYLPRTERE